MKTVLIITYYFPPSGGAGVQRVLKFVKYLPEFGWQPVVLTVSEKSSFPVLDQSLSEEIPKGIRIVRTPLFEPYKLYRIFTKRPTGQGTDIAALNQERREFKDRIAEWIRSTFFIPDARCYWKRPGTSAGKKLLRQLNADLIFSSAPPYTVHLIAKNLAFHTGLPWVADFRDSWVGWLSAPRRWWLPRQIDLRMERSVLQNADHITHVSKGIRADLESRHPVSDGKWTLLPNGFDSADFQGIRIHPPNGRFVMTYSGSLYGHRNPQIFIEGLKKFLDDKPSARNHIRIRFVGRIDPAFQLLFRTMGPVVEVIPYVTHQESIRMLVSSHALLLIIDRSPASQSIITGKLYEYLGAGRPILALAPEGEAASLIRDLKAGIVIDPDDAVKVGQTLSEMVMKWEKGVVPAGGNEMKDRYNRKQLTRELAGIFDSFHEKK